MKKRTLKLPGRIYQKYNLREGERVYQTTWTVRYKGKDYATGETDFEKAKQHLLARAGGLSAPVKPKPWIAALAAVTAPAADAPALMSKVFDLFIADSKRRNLASAPGNEGIVRNYLCPFFGEIPVTQLTTQLFNAYKDMRMETVKDADEAAKLSRGATVNRELAALKRALNFSMRVEDPPLLQRYPKIEMLPESKPRKGFLAHRSYARLRHALPEYWEPVFVTAYHVGRRRGELLQIELLDVDMDRTPPQMRVYGDITKNGEPSIIPIYGDMIETLRKQIQMTRRDYPECRLLFHKNGKPIQKNQTFYDEWNAACEVAGVPGLLGHDLRRTACKMLIDSGCSRKEAMQISGHKTESAFNRYHIVDQDSMTATVAKATAFLAKQRAALLEAEATGLIS